MSDSGAYLRQVRNIGIIAHIDAGKTTLTERILFYTNKIHRMGEVHEGAATMDFIPEEQEHGITIASAATSCEWKNCQINIIDTPGHVDFNIEVERSLRVLDGAIIVFCAVGGVEPQSEVVWRQAEKFQIPKLIFINKMDRIGANFFNVVNEVAEKFKVKPIPLVLPIGSEDTFEAVLDLLTMQRLDFDPQSQGKIFSYSPLSVEEQALASKWRDHLLEALADHDDSLLQKYLNGEDIDQNLIKQVLHKATIEGSLIPVFAGSALRNTGIQLVLDAIVNFLPNPLEAKPVVGEEFINGVPAGKKNLPADSSVALAALVFKVNFENSRKICFVRVYAGTLQEGDDCINMRCKEKERIGKMYKVNADELTPVNQARAGEIVAVQGLKNVQTGDSLARGNRQFLLENISALQPVISVVLEAKNTPETKILHNALQHFCQEDPTLDVQIDENSGQIIVSGMGELHLEVMVERLQREYKIIPRVSTQQVICHETLQGTGRGQAEFNRELGDIQHYGFVGVQVAPRERGQGNLVRWVMNTEGWNKEWLAAIEEAVEDSLLSGVVDGYSVQDVLIEITELKKEEGKSTSTGYRMATMQAVKNAMTNAGVTLLEPIMYLEISVPEDFIGAALNILSIKHGHVDSIVDRTGIKQIKAFAPMRALFGFSTALRSATQGRASLMLRFERFDTM